MRGVTAGLAMAALAMAGSSPIDNAPRHPNPYTWGRIKHRAHVDTPKKPRPYKGSKAAKKASRKGKR